MTHPVEGPPPVGHCHACKGFHPQNITGNHFWRCEGCGTLSTHFHDVQYRLPGSGWPPFECLDCAREREERGRANAPATLDQLAPRRLF